MDWKEWFEKHGEMVMPLGTGVTGTHISMIRMQTEELYQAFKARLMDELVVTSPELLNSARLESPPHYTELKGILKD